MGRLITLTNGNDRFTQGFSANNVEIRVFALGGRDTIILDRDDDLGGGSFVNAGDGADRVRNDIENGSVIKLGDVNGDGTADFQILLSGAGAMLASDFLL